MGMFSRLLGRKASAKERLARSSTLMAPSVGKPTSAAAASGRIWVDFHAHDHVEGVPGNFLTAITQGLNAHGQRELVLTMRLADGEEALAKMQDMVRFFTIVHAWAGEGNLVDEAGFTQFGERGLFGRPHSGVLYTDARPCAGIELPARALAAIFVDAEEIRAARDSGTYRVLTRIGEQLRVFPFPAWGALDRPSAMTPRESESVLLKVPRMRARGAYFVMADQCLRVSVPITKALLGGASSLPVGSPFALLMRPAASANAILVWHPGQVGLSGISAEGSDNSRLSGSFLLLMPGEQPDHIRQIEDGYSVQLSNESWAELSGALIEARPLSLDLEGGQRFELEWLSEADA